MKMEISKIENKIKKKIYINSLFFENIYKTDKPIARLIKKEKDRDTN